MRTVVIGDDRVGRVEYRAGGAIVLLQLDDSVFGKSLLEAMNVFDACAAPAID